MKPIFRTLVCSLVALLAAVGAARAHPHVWVTMTSELVYAPDGAVTGVRHAWAFDDMFSAFATQGIETKQKGVFTREDLAPLAQVNVDSLKDFDYFTVAKANGKKTEFEGPKDYWLEYKDEVLVLHFTLPFKAPVKAQRLDLEVYDPTYFVDFTMAEKDPVKLVNAPGECKLMVVRPTRPRQGGDLLLSDRQPGDLAARRRALVRFRHGAGARRGRHRRHRGGAARRDAQHPVHRRLGDRSRELQFDHRRGRAAAVGQGPRLSCHPAHAAPRAAAGAGRGRGDRAACASRSRSRP